MRSDTDATGVPQLDDIARMLEAAAADAPRAPRMELARAALLDSIPAHRPSPLLAPLAVAAVVLLGVLLAVGAPAVGSMISDMLDRVGPAPALPEPTDGTPPTDTDATVDAPSVVSPSADAALPKRPATDGAATPPIDSPPVATPRPGDDEPPGGVPGPPADPGPPMPVPTPPVITPPPTGPPPGVPAP